MKSVFSGAAILLLSVISGQAAPQIDLPLCEAGDGKTPVPRWEVTAVPVEANGDEAQRFTYSVDYPPPAYHSFIGHLRVNLGARDEASCSTLRQQLIDAEKSGLEPSDVLVTWQYEEGGPLSGETFMQFFGERPEFAGGACWMDGVFQFVALNTEKTELQQYRLNRIPLGELQNTGLFCRPIQEG